MNKLSWKFLVLLSIGPNIWLSIFEGRYFLKFFISLSCLWQILGNKTFLSLNSWPVEMSSMLLMLPSEWRKDLMCFWNIKHQLWMFLIANIVTLFSHFWFPFLIFTWNIKWWNNFLPFFSHKTIVPLRASATISLKNIFQSALSSLEPRTKYISPSAPEPRGLNSAEYQRHRNVKISMLSRRETDRHWLDFSRMCLKCFPLEEDGPHAIFHFLFDCVKISGVCREVGGAKTKDGLDYHTLRLSSRPKTCILSF